MAWEVGGIGALARILGALFGSNPHVLAQRNAAAERFRGVLLPLRRSLDPVLVSDAEDAPDVADVVWRARETVRAACDEFEAFVPDGIEREKFREARTGMEEFVASFEDEMTDPFSMAFTLIDPEDAAALQGSQDDRHVAVQRRQCRLRTEAIGHIDALREFADHRAS